MLKLVVATSHNYKKLFDYFVASLNVENTDDGPNGVFDLNVHDIDFTGFNRFGFQTESWYHAVREKIVAVVNCLEHKAAEDEYIVFSDADIQFFKPGGIHTLVQEAKDGGYDYYGIPEGYQNEFNTGFFIVRNTPQVRAFFQKVVDLLKVNRYPLGDQTIINRLIHSNENQLVHAKIPLKYVVCGPVTPVGVDSIMHHAICTFDKMAQLIDIKRKYDALMIR